MLSRLIQAVKRRIAFLRNAIRYAKDGPEVRVEKVGLIHGKTLVGKTILITGGSSGIGLEMARKFISEGAMVIISGRREEKLKAAVASIDGDAIDYLVWDVSDLTALTSMMKKLESLCLNGIDVLVNNAGIANRQRFGALTPEAWDAVYNTNLRGVAFTTQAFVNKWLTEKKRAVVLNIASMAAFECAEDAYSTGKAALVALTRGLGKKYAALGIRINSIAPGVVIGTDLNQIQRAVFLEDNLKCGWVSCGRYGIPAEIAELATFMVSDAANYIFGQTIVCDGGKTL